MYSCRYSCSLGDCSVISVERQLAATGGSHGTCFSVEGRELLPLGALRAAAPGARPKEAARRVLRVALAAWRKLARDEQGPLV